MSNNIKNSISLFKVQLKWNAKSMTFWITIASYILISTIASLAFTIFPMLVYEISDINNFIYGEQFVYSVSFIHIVMVSVLVNILIVRVYVNDKKHKVIELEQRAGYNKFAIFYSRLTWLVVTIFLTILFNFLISCGFYFLLKQDGLEDFIYAMFVGIFGWEVVFALMYLLLFLIILFVGGAKRASLLSVIMLIVLNLSPLNNLLNGSVSQTRMGELRWSVEHDMWFNDTKEMQEDDGLQKFKEFYAYDNANNFNYFGYEYYEKMKDLRQFDEGQEQDQSFVGDFYKELEKVVTDDVMGIKTKDVYLFGAEMGSYKVNKTIYDFKDKLLNLDYSSMDAKYNNVLNILKHYLSELSLIDTYSPYAYSEYARMADHTFQDGQSSKEFLKEKYENKASILMTSTLIHWIFINHEIWSQNMYSEKDGELVTYTSYKNLIEQSNPSWYVKFNPSKSEILNMMFNPLMHLSLMQRTSFGLKTGTKQAANYVKSNSLSAYFGKNIKIVYEDGEFKGFDRIIHSEWIILFYIIISLVLIPFTYLLWRRKNK